MPTFAQWFDDSVSLPGLTGPGQDRNLALADPVILLRTIQCAASIALTGTLRPRLPLTIRKAPTFMDGLVQNGAAIALSTIASGIQL